MGRLLRLIGVFAVFCVASVAWVVLGSTMSHRTTAQTKALRGRVHDLWGVPHAQKAPEVAFVWESQETVEEPIKDDRGKVVHDDRGRPALYTVLRTRQHVENLDLIRSELAVNLGLDQRRKGLLWFSLYDVDFEGAWRFKHDGQRTGHARIVFQLPEADAVYDGFHFLIDGHEVESPDIQAGKVQATIPIIPGQTVDFAFGYRSRGMDSWVYKPGEGVGSIRDFALRMTTDFPTIDFPAYTLSPSTRTRHGDGWALDWAFDQILTGHGIGMVMPQKIQPGPLAASMSYTAPISLGLFIVWVTVLGLVRDIEVHPMNHLFIAAAFFAFHLLFGYVADHLAVEWAFALSSAVSVALVVSYLRLVVSPRFALVEAGLAQLLYLVGFSLAHFWAGLTGLTVTVLGICTLFALMQLTGRIRWAEVFASDSARPKRPAPEAA
jgi:hypothetical protein